MFNCLTYTIIRQFRALYEADSDASPNCSVKDGTGQFRTE